MGSRKSESNGKTGRDRGHVIDSTHSIKQTANRMMPHFHFYPVLFRIDEGDQLRRKGGTLHMLSRETESNSYTHTRLDYHATVRELPSHERPRGRLQHCGRQALPVAQLSASTRRTSTGGGKAPEVANNVLPSHR